MQHKASLSLFEYWNHRRGERTAPRRSEISPAGIQSLLPSIFIVKRDTNGNFVFLLAGTGICALFGRELRHTPLTDIWHANHAGTTREVAETVVEIGRPAALQSRAISRSGRLLPVEILFLPLQAEPDGTQCFLGAITELEQPLWLDDDPLDRFEVTTARLLDMAESRPAQPASAPADHAHAAIFRSRGNDLTRLQRLTLIETGNTD